MTSSLRKRAVLLALMCGATASSPAEPPQQILPPSGPALLPPDAAFVLKLPPSDAVTYRGLVDKDGGAGQPGAMLYPAYGLVGALAAIATHGVVVSAMAEQEKSRQQEVADKATLPYRSTIDLLSQRAMAQQALDSLPGKSLRKVLAADEPASGDGWVIESTPQFAVSASVSAIVLDQAVQLYAADRPNEVRYRNLIRVVSNPRTPTGPAEVSEEQQRQFKDDSVGLVAEAVRVLLADLASERKPDQVLPPDTTVRYIEGSVPRSERGKVLSEHCGRVVMRNLRGWLMSVPQRPAPGTAPDPNCGSQATEASSAEKPVS